VARLAGMPREVIESAERTLRDLERREKHASAMALEDDGSVQLSFFQLDDPTLSAIKEKLASADLNNMTPLQAFDLLRALKGELGI
jgi:DNA mismatch repair protein MutS